MIKQRAITRVDKAEKSPERCMVCHDDSSSWYIDTGLDTTFDGTFYICKGCVDKIVAQSHEHFNREQMTRLLNEYKNLKDEATTKMNQAYHELAISREQITRVREAIQ